MYSIRIRQLLQCLILSVALSIIKAKSSTYLTPTGWQQSPQDFQFENDDAQVVLPESSDSIEISSHRNYEKEIARCGKDDNKILLSFILRSNQWNEVSDKKKERAINKLSNFFAVQKNFISLDNVSRKEVFEMTQHSSRRGLSQPSTKSNRKLGRMQFMIGCGTNLFPVGELISNQIAEQMLDGSINEICGLDFGMWIIWSKPVDSRLARSKRQTDEGSGELNDADDDDYNDDYYEDEDEEQDEEVTEDIPVEQPTVQPKHKNRHHHGEKPNIENDSKSQAEPTIRNDQSSVVTQKVFEKSKSETTIVPSPPLVTRSETRSPDINDIQNGLSKLESTISKTIENNTNKLKEEEQELQKFLNENKKHHHNVAVSAIAAESNRDTPNIEKIIVDDIVPIFETIAEDEQIEINTKKFKSMEHDYVIEGVATVKKLKDSDQVGSSRSTIPQTKSFETTLPVTQSSTIYLSSLSPSTSLQSSSTEIPTPLDPLTTTQSVILTTTEFSLVDSTSKTNKVFGVVTDSDDDYLEITSVVPTTTATTVTTLITTTVNEAASGTSIHKDEDDALDTPDETPTEKSISQSDHSKHLAFNEYFGQQKTTTGSPPSSASVDQIVPIIDTINPTVPDSEYGDYDDIIDEDDENELSTPTSPTTTTTTIIAPTTSQRTIPKFMIETTTLSTTEVTTTEPSTTPTLPPFNSPPFIKNRMPKQALPVGKPFSLKLSDDIFYDEEDSLLNIELLDEHNNNLDANSWVQFNDKTNEIYGLPLENSVSNWIYHLRASDSGGKSVIEAVDLTVQQNKYHRSENHEISIGIKLLKKFTLHVDWQIHLIRGIAEVLNEKSTSNILVREIINGAQDSNEYTFVYSNETIPKPGCPEKELEDILNVLTASALTKSLAPEIAVRSVQAELISVCKKTTQVPKKEDTVSAGENSRPFPRNPVDSVIATVGQLLIFKVPSDTFFDKEDPVLSLSLLTSERAPLDPKNWLQFDSKNNEFFGIPKYPDIGQKEYLLIAEDRGGLAGYDALIVTVKPANKRDYSLAIEIPIGVPYDAFNSLQQRRFVEQILEIFNETSTSHIRIQSIRPFQNYSIVSFYNTTMFKIHHRCPDDEIEALKNIYVSSDGSLRSNVKKQLADFNVNSISFIPKGPCQGFDPIHHEPIIPIKANEPTSPKSVQDDYLLTFVLPAVIILSMLLLASIIACYLHRRRLRGKMELGDEEERRSFRSKGIPVIFQDELDEKPEIGNKSPIILKNEKPPLLPPSYTSTNPDDNEDMDDYVPPPAVMMGGRESRGKSPVTPSYRKPPPYVSP